MKIDKVSDKIKDFAKTLKLPYTLRNIDEEIKEANKENLTYEDFLLSILENESDLRKANGIKSRIRLAKFPYKKYIEENRVRGMIFMKKNISSLTLIDSSEFKSRIENMMKKVLPESMMKPKK